MTARPARAKRDAMLTVAQAAERLGVARHYIYEWVYSGALPAVQYPGRTGKPNGPIRIAETDVDAFIKEHKRAS